MRRHDLSDEIQTPVLSPIHVPPSLPRWTALVDRVVTTKEGERTFDVLIEADGTLMSVEPEQMRLGYVWLPEESVFVRRRVTPPILKKVWILGQTTKIIIQTILQSPSLSIDGIVVAQTSGDGLKKSSKVKVREEGERRSQRPKSSRLVQIDGYQVLKENLYDLDNGEPSVFDRELKAKDDQCLLPPSASLPSSEVPLMPPQALSNLSNKGPAYLFHGSGVYPGQKQVAAENEEEGVRGEVKSSRLDHNESVRKDRAKLEGVRR